METFLEGTANKPTIYCKRTWKDLERNMYGTWEKPKMHLEETMKEQEDTGLSQFRA